MVFSFRQMPTFGRFTIRRFTNNVSELKNLAGRDLEDILQVGCPYCTRSSLLIDHFQCSIPCFEGLLPPEDDAAVCMLLFVLCYWHSLAKLRMHTTSSLSVMDDATTLLGSTLRSFQAVTCSAWPTTETAAEQAARARAYARWFEKSTHPGPSVNPGPLGQGRCPRTFNLKTIKIHFLGDYVSQIPLVGPADGHSTAVVSHNLNWCYRAHILSLGRTQTP